MNNKNKKTKNKNSRNDKFILHFGNSIKNNKFIFAFLILNLTIISLFTLSRTGVFDKKTIDKINPSPDFLSTNSNQNLVIKNTVPVAKTLNNSYHIFQTYNNCGPAALSMALSYFGFNISQEELGRSLRPYQVAGGDNDDKSVTLSELEQEAKNLGLETYHRPMGDINLIKQLIAEDIPLITRTWTYPNEDIGHYRIVKGYDEDLGVIIQDDSLQGKNLEYSYEDFNTLWEKFNFEYLIVFPKDKLEIVNSIMDKNIDEKFSWEKSIEFSENKLNKNPEDIYGRFNLSVAYFHTKNYQKSIEEYEKIENQLPFRTLWYQIEPIKSYYELKNYDRVLTLTEKILNNQNKAFSELYILRALVFKNNGNLSLAINEAEKAVYYNNMNKQAQNLLEELK